MATNSRQLKDLLEIMVGFSTVSEARAFLQDLCTPKELESLSDRWRVAQLIDKGMSYRDIAEKTSVSTATITRVGRSLKYGEKGYHWALAQKKSSNSR